MMSGIPDTNPNRAVVKHVNCHLLFILLLLVYGNLASGVLRVPVRLFDKPLESLGLIKL